MPTFEDVPASHPFYHEIEAVAAVQIGRGTSVSPPLFSPDVSITVGELDAWLMRAIRWQDATRPEADTDLPQLAVDVGPTHAYFGEVQRAIRIGIHGGPERVDYNPGEVEGGGSASNAFSIAWDGTASYVSVVDADLSGATDFTVSAWVKPSVGGAPRTAFNASDDTSPSTGCGINLAINGTGSRRVIAEFWIGGAYRFASYDASIADATWHHVGMVREGTTLTLYVDGVARATRTVAATALTITDAFVGAYRVNGENRAYWLGNIDNPQAWTRALTAGEMEDLRAGRTVGSTSLVGSWAFNEGTGTTTADAGSGANAGTLTGAGVTWSTDTPLVSSGGGAAEATRGLGITFLMRALALVELDIATARFSDVADGSQWHGYVERAASRGTIGRTGSALFEPGSPLLRSRLACWIQRAFTVPYVTSPVGTPQGE